MSGPKVIVWTEDERQALIAEALRLRGQTKSAGQAMDMAQQVLPKKRRRVIGGVKAHAPWFYEAWVQSEAAPAPAPAAAPAAAPAPASKSKVFWSRDEKKILCREAARLVGELQAGSRREALMKAQEVLPAERRRPIASMTTVEDWFPDGLMAAVETLRREKQEAQAALEQQQAPTPEPQPAAVATAAASDLEIAHGADVVSAASLPAAVQPSFMNMLGGTPWAALREHLVQEIASLVGEGIRRGIESVQLTPSAVTADSTPVRPHVPFLRDGRAKESRPSVLVVGLKESQAAQIEADFGKQLDLRFCTADQSKDHLRHMTERADMSVAVVDFLSHSHTDIIKARSRAYVESRGGLTHLRQELTKLVPTNGAQSH